MCVSVCVCECVCETHSGSAVCVSAFVITQPLDKVSAWEATALMLVSATT